MTERLPARRSELTPVEIELVIDVLEGRTEALAAARAAIGYVADDEDWPTTKFYRRLQGKFWNMLPKKAGRRASVLIEIGLNIIARKKSEGVKVLPTCRRLAPLLWPGLDAKSLEKKARSLESAFHKRDRERKKIKDRKYPPGPA